MLLYLGKLPTMEQSCVQQDQVIYLYMDSLLFSIKKEYRLTEFNLDHPSTISFFFLCLYWVISLPFIPKKLMWVHSNRRQLFPSEQEGISYQFITQEIFKNLLKFRRAFLKLIINILQNCRLACYVFANG